MPLVQVYKSCSEHLTVGICHNWFDGFDPFFRADKVSTVLDDRGVFGSESVVLLGELKVIVLRFIVHVEAHSDVGL